MELSLSLWDKANLAMMHDLFEYVCIWFTAIFKFMFIGNVGLLIHVVAVMFFFNLIWVLVGFL